MEYSLFSSDKETEILQVAEILSENHLEFYTTNVHTQNLIGLGSYSGSDPLLGPMQVIVKASDRETATRLTEGLVSIFEQQQD